MNYIDDFIAECRKEGNTKVFDGGISLAECYEKCFENNYFPAGIDILQMLIKADVIMNKDFYYDSSTIQKPGEIRTASHDELSDPKKLYDAGWNLLFISKGGVKVITKEENLKDDGRVFGIKLELMERYKLVSAVDNLSKNFPDKLDAFNNDDDLVNSIKKYI